MAIELESSFAVGPLQVRELRVLLTDVRFPVDLTGGVPRFRHHRGRLERLSIDVNSTELARLLIPRLRNLFRSPELTIAPTAWGGTIGVADEDKALAFELLVIPSGPNLLLLIDRARGIGLDIPVFLMAHRVVSAMVGGEAETVGGALVLRASAQRITRHLLPLAGARAPQVPEMSFSWGRPASIVQTEEDRGEDPHRRMSLSWNMEDSTAAPNLRSLSRLELEGLLGQADAALVDGRTDEARRAYLHALQQAPRHRQICERIASIDLAEGGRDEAALSTLVEAAPALEGGFLGGELLARIGDPAAAYEAYRRMSDSEPYGFLAGLGWLSASRTAPSKELALSALDDAVTRAPLLSSIRWARFAARLAEGNAVGALADAEHVEANSVGPEKRMLACVRAGDALFTAGYSHEAQKRYERALRYRPTEPHALVGLGRALADHGRPERALEVLTRASELVPPGTELADLVQLEIARLLGSFEGNQPLAIARLGQISSGGLREMEARLLETELRIRIADFAGASRASGRLRNLTRGADVRPGDRPLIARLLARAAKVDEEQLFDLAAAEHSLSLALQLVPGEPALSREFRRLVRLRRDGPSPVVKVEEVREKSPAPPVVQPIEPLIQLESEPSDEELEGEIEDLTSKIRANPTDAIVADRLAYVLERLGRELELLSLISAQVDEASEENRPKWVASRTRVLDRLATTARQEGRTSEAELYELMRDQT